MLIINDTESKVKNTLQIPQVFEELKFYFSFSKINENTYVLQN